MTWLGKSLLGLVLSTAVMACSVRNSGSTLDPNRESATYDISAEPDSLASGQPTQATSFRPSKPRDPPSKPGRPPVVFVPGFAAPSSLWEDSCQLRDFFSENGYRFLVARSLQTNSLESRANHLYYEIQRLVPTGRFHLIGHSMGGLDSRLLIKNWGFGSRVVSLTTISTPHRGTRLAELAEKLTCPFQSLCPSYFVPASYQTAVDALRNLTPRYLNEVFNPQISDDPRVRYYSLSFYMSLPLKSPVPLYWWGHSILSAYGDTHNDGMVPAHSANWGESLGWIESDHASETLPIPYAGQVVYPQVFGRIVHKLNELK